MKLHWWIEFSGRKKIAVFLLAMVLIALFSVQLPAEAWQLRGRQWVPTPFTMCTVWAAGWFSLLFVRAEDLHVTAPYNFQSLFRWLGGALIVTALGMAVLFYLIYSRH